MACGRGSNLSSSLSPLISLHDVRKVYGRRLVLNIAEFSLGKHEPLALLGENASGKSTLLRLLAGVTQPSSGRFERSPEWRGAKIGIVPQSGGINPDLSVAENLWMYRRLYECDSAVTLSERPLVRDFGLVDYLDERAGNLSGGFQRIVTIVSALDVEPDGILLDEPFSGLDARYSEQLHRVLQERAKQLLFLIMTEHAAENLPPVRRQLVLVGGEPQ